MKEAIAVKEYKSKQLQVAVNNVLASLKQIGLTNSIVKVDEDSNIAYIAINIDDIAKLLQRNCRKSVEKGCGKQVEVLAIKEDNYIVIRVSRL